MGVRELTKHTYMGKVIMCTCYTFSGSSFCHVIANMVKYE